VRSTLDLCGIARGRGDGAVGGGLDRLVAARVVGVPVGVPDLRDAPALARGLCEIFFGIGRVDAHRLAAGGIVQQIAVIVRKAGELVDL
jgi:hypothetical protein